MPLDDRTVRANVARDMVNGVGSAVFLTGVYANGAVVIRRMGGDDLAVAVITAIPFLTNVLVLLLMPALPRRKPVLLLVGASVAARLAAIPAGWSPSPGYIIVSWLVLAMGLSLAALPAVDVVSGMYPPNRRAHLVSRVRTVALGAALVTGPLAGALLDRLGPGLTFSIIGAATAAAGIAYLGVVAPQPTARPRVSLLDALRVLHDAPYRRFTLAWTLWGAGTFLPLAAYPVLLVDRFHASYTVIGLLGAATGASSLLTYRWWARRSERTDPRGLAAAGFVLAALVPVVYAVAPSAAVLTVASVLSGLSVGALEMGNLQALLRFAPPGDALRYTAVLNAFAGLRGAAAPLLGSLLITRVGPAPVLIVGALVGLAGAAYMASGIRTALTATPLPGRSGPAITEPVARRSG